MSLIKVLYNTVLDALFPTSKAEQEVLAMDECTAFHSLPRAKKSPIHEACSIFSYKDDRVWRLIWCIKYKKSKPAARIAGYALFKALKTFSRAAFPIIIVPMPITKQRRRERGFNQCELIADEIEKLKIHSAKSMEIAAAKSNGIFIVRDLLIRTRHKSRQTMKDREERLASTKDMFAVNQNAADKLDTLYNIRNLPGTKINQTPTANYLVIVIDDVVTTGSTIRDAISTLREAGFEKTFGISVAH